MTWLIIAAVWTLATLVTWSILKTAGDADDRIAQMTHDYHVGRDAFGNEVIFPVQSSGSAPVPTPAEPDQTSETTPADLPAAPRRWPIRAGGPAAETGPPTTPRSQP